MRLLSLEGKEWPSDRKCTCFGVDGSYRLVRFAGQNLSNED